MDREGSLVAGGPSEVAAPAGDGGTGAGDGDDALDVGGSVKKLNRKLGELEALLRQSLLKLGLKYTADLSVRALVGDVRDVHVAETRRLVGEVKRARAAEEEARLVLDREREERHAEVVELRKRENERLRVLRQTQERAVSRQVAERRSALEQELQAHRDEDVARRVADAERQCEERVRAELEAFFGRRTEQQLAAMEAQAKELLRRKNEECKQARKQAREAQEAAEAGERRAAEADARVADAERRALQAEEEVGRLGSRLQRIQAEAAEAAATIARHEAAVQRRVTEDKERHARELLTMRDREVLQVAEIGRLKEELERTERRADDMRRTLKEEYARELDAVPQRVQGVLQKKDETIARLRHQLDEQAAQLAQAEAQLERERRDIASLLSSTHHRHQQR